jgi:glycosyltransferase involved in cell wall biosynthesis
MPKLSIITICRNDKAGLVKTMESVFRQAFRDYEYIVIDGGSTDGSLAEIEKHATQLAFWVSEKDSGIYNAQNKGWTHAKGEYCLFLNAGDFLAADDTLEKIFSHSVSAGIVYGDLLVDNGKDEPYLLTQPEKFSFEDFIRSTLFHPAAFIRREILVARKGYDESFRIVADYDFFMETILVKKYSTVHVPVPVAVFNTAGIGSSAKHARQHDAERKRAQLKYFSEPEIKNAEKKIAHLIPRSVRWRKATRGIPVLRGLVEFAIFISQDLRKLFRR